MLILVISKPLTTYEQCEAFQDSFSLPDFLTTYTTYDNYL